MTYVIAATGHRPNKIRVSFEHLTDIAYTFLKEAKPDYAVSGMAQGWDTVFAVAALANEIPLVAAVPWPGQSARWGYKTVSRTTNY